MRFLHTASPYVAGHRGRTFVVTIPGEVVARKERLYPLLEGALQLQLCPGGKGSTRQGRAQDVAGPGGIGAVPRARFAAVSGVSRVCRCSIGCEGQPIIIVKSLHCLPADSEEPPSPPAPLPADILLLHGLGVKLVVVCGAHAQVSEYLEARGRGRQLVGAYRVTDEVAMQGAIEAAGTTTTVVSAFLSKVRWLSWCAGRWLVCV